MKLGFKRGEKGFTLVELMVVMAILAVLSAIVFPAITGTTTTSRQTRQPVDINSVQTGVDRFNADDTDGSPWPSQSSDSDLSIGASTQWSAGNLPSGTATGTGTSGDPYVFTEFDIASANWTAAATVDGSTNVFFPGYVRNKPGYAATTISVGSGGSEVSAVFAIKKGGETVYVQLSNTNTANATTFSVWGLDKNGSVWVFKDADSY